MNLRTIMIFPEFNNIALIDGIRKQYDPLAGLVRPHITLVFPFESQMSNEDLKGILESRLSEVKPFEIQLRGISKCADTFGNYLFLNVVQGVEEICAIHQQLYDNEFKEFNLGLPYVPHMTVGRLEDAYALEQAYIQASEMVREAVFTAIVNKVSVEMIGDHEESIIVVEKKLRESVDFER